MKTYIYEVAGWEFVDTIAFGAAWREAKLKATQLHAAIYRSVVKGEETRKEVYTKAGCFISVEMAKEEIVAIF